MSRLWWSPLVLLVALCVLELTLGSAFDLYRVGMPLMVLLGLAGVLRLPKRQRRKLSPLLVTGVLLVGGALVVGRNDTVGLRWSQDMWSLLGLFGIALSILWLLGLFEEGSTKRELVDVAALASGLVAIGMSTLSSGWTDAQAGVHTLAVTIVVVNATLSAIGVVFLAPEIRWNIAARWLLVGLQLELVTYISFLAASSALHRSEWYVVSWLVGLTILCCGVRHPSMVTLERRRREVTRSQVAIAASSITTGTAGGAFALITADGETVVMVFGVLACVVAGARTMLVVQEAWTARLEMQAVLQRERVARDTERELLRELMHDDVVQMLAAASWLEENDETRELVLRAQRRTSSLLNGERPPVPSFGAIEESLKAALAPFGSKTEWEVLTPAGCETLTNDAVWAVIREAAVNVTKHARAAHGRVELIHRDGAMVVVVTDDGVGVSEAGNGMGWHNMRAVVSHAGGELSISRAHTGGTVLEASIPL